MVRSERHTAEHTAAVATVQSGMETWTTFRVGPNKAEFLGWGSGWGRGIVPLLSCDNKLSLLSRFPSQLSFILGFPCQQLASRTLFVRSRAVRFHRCSPAGSGYNWLLPARRENIKPWEAGGGAVGGSGGGGLAAETDQQHVNVF